MAFTVRFRVSDPLAARHGEIVSFTCDELIEDQMAPGQLVAYHKDEQITSFNKEDLIGVE